MTGYEGRHNYNSKCDEDDFMVAADFTLYSNPVNRALYRPPSPPSGENKSPKPSDVTDDPPVAEKSNEAQQEVETDEWIASDMTKYDSPLAELERQGRDRDARLALTEASAETKGAQGAPPTDPTDP